MFTFTLIYLATLTSLAYANTDRFRPTAFALVDEDGIFIKGDELGLLIYKGGTVCYSGTFDMDAADAICKAMGYTDAIRWSSGEEKYEVQSVFKIKLDSVRCSETEWDSCSYEEGVITYCEHNDDVFLSCNPTDTKRKLFALVDSEGNYIEGEDQVGLVLYNGGTVCDDSLHGYDGNVANAICKAMGYPHALKWGLMWEGFDIRNNYDITLGDVRCNAPEWESCGYNDVKYAIKCLHSLDMFLGCKPTGKEIPLFGLLDAKGNYMEGEDGYGLLMYNGGTVCDDHFDSTAADAICKKMGYTHSTGWTSSAISFDIKNKFPINLDNVICNSADWTDCSFSESHNCRHSEDVFLSCNPPEDDEEEEEEEEEKESEEEDETPTADRELIWMTAEHSVPVEYSSGCVLKVRTPGRWGSNPTPTRTNWNGDIMFFAGDQELLYIGLHPKRRKLAVRNDVFERGTFMPRRNYRWVEATYPEADEEGKRHYTFYFTAAGFGLKSGHDSDAVSLIFIPYDELTNNIGEFTNGINSVKFGLKYSPVKGPLQLEYATDCPV